MTNACYPEGHPAGRVLVNLARLAHAQAAGSAEQDVEMVEKANLPDGVLHIAARPLPVPDADDIDPTQRRAGWIDLLARADDLARRCVREGTRWDGGGDLPFSNTQQIEEIESTWAYKWTQRLIPTQRTAAFELLAEAGEPGDALVDPDTDAPVWRSCGKYTAAMPQRLPATAPLAELILDGPVWIRTADGKVYPAPRAPRLLLRPRLGLRRIRPRVAGAARRRAARRHQRPGPRGYQRRTRGPGGPAVPQAAQPHRAHPRPAGSRPPR